MGNITSVFEMDVNTCMEFWERVKAKNANIEKERHDILVELANEGKMNRVYTTKRSVQEVMKDLSKHSHVLQVKNSGIKSKKK